MAVNASHTGAARPLYRVLGVGTSASSDDIKKAYRGLARRLHPDRNPDDPSAEARFKEVQAAYDVLGDDTRRSLYDEFGDASLQSGFDAGRARAWQRRGGFGGDPFGGGVHVSGFDGMDIDDLFGQVFGHQTRRRGPRRGADFAAELTTDFRTAALGGVRELQLGDGRIIKVRVPPGMGDGGVIRVPKKGGAAPPGGTPGDLRITFRVQPDPVFRRDGLDLHVELPVSVSEAIRGGKIEVPTLSGAVRAELPPGSASGKRLRLRGKGVERNGERGDLYASIRIEVPGHLDAELLDAIDAAYETSPIDARRKLG